MEDEEEDRDEDEIPLKRRLRRKVETGCDNNGSTSVGSLMLQNPKEENPKVCFSIFFSGLSYII